MTSTPNPTFSTFAKAVAVALEAKGRGQYDRLLLKLHQRNVERTAVLAKWLWKQLFSELQSELAKGPGNRDIKKVAELVRTMRKLVPPPPGRNDKQVGIAQGLAADFGAALTRARQRTAEEAADEAAQEDEDVETFNREVYDQVPPADDSAGDPTDVGTKEDLGGFAAAKERWAGRLGQQHSRPESHPHGEAFPNLYGVPPFD